MINLLLREESKGRWDQQGKKRKGTFTRFNYEITRPPVPRHHMTPKAQTAYADIASTLIKALINVGVA